MGQENNPAFVEAFIPIIQDTMICCQTIEKILESKGNDVKILTQLQFALHYLGIAKCWYYDIENVERSNDFDDLFILFDNYLNSINTLIQSDHRHNYHLENYESLALKFDYSPANIGMKDFEKI